MYIQRSQKANSVDPDETARYEPSHLDLHCLHRYMFWSAVLKGLTMASYTKTYFSFKLECNAVYLFVCVEFLR